MSRIKKKPVKFRIILRKQILKMRKRLLMRIRGQITIVLLRFSNSLFSLISHNPKFVLPYPSSSTKQQFQSALAQVAMPPVGVVSRIARVRNRIRNGKSHRENKVSGDISARMLSTSIPIANSSHYARKNSKNGGKSLNMHRNDSKKWLIMIYLLAANSNMVIPKVLLQHP